MGIPWHEVKARKAQLDRERGRTPNGFRSDLAEDLRRPHLWLIYWCTRAKITILQRWHRRR